MKPTTLTINEIFYSIQGESTWAGCPCVFIRLMGCHLRCRYCDTEYAFHEGNRRTLDEICAEVDRLAGPDARLSGTLPGTLSGTLPGVIQVTGGEPLLQPGVHELMTRLCDAGNTVLVETSGACDISRCDPRVIRIMDLKTPGSGEVARNRLENIEHLTDRDEVKFVICSREDYEWARDAIRRYDLASRVRAVLLSAVHEMPTGRELPGATGLPLRDLAEWMLADRLPARMQTQLHKLIWDPMTRGV